MQVTKTEAANLWHRHLVYQDSAFQRDLAALPPHTVENLTEIYEEYRRLGFKYGIDAAAVDYMHDRPGAIFDPIKPPGGALFYPPDPNNDPNMMVARIPLWITKNQFYELWRDVRKAQQRYGTVRSTKTKPPKRPRLLYAIYKARKTLPWSEIFDRYQLDQLGDEVESDGAPFATPYDLKKYYERYYRTDI